MPQTARYPFGTPLIRTHTFELAELGRQHDLSTPVPTCGKWALDDLIWHLTEVQSFWLHAIANRPAGPESYTAPERPPNDELPDLLTDRCALLVAVLDAADPAEAAWSWSDDHTVRFSIRRQTHEALIHHLDGVLAVGADLPAIEPTVAADGVDELVTVMLSGVPDWADYEPTSDSLQLTASDAGDTWNLRFGRMIGTSPDTGTSYDLTALELLDELDAPTTQISARGLDLELWMWGRRDDTAVAIGGAPNGAGRLRAAVVESTQ